LKKNVEILIIDSERLPALVLKKPVFNPRDWEEVAMWVLCASARWSNYKFRCENRVNLVPNPNTFQIWRNIRKIAVRSKSQQQFQQDRSNKSHFQHYNKNTIKILLCTWPVTTDFWHHSSSHDSKFKDSTRFLLIKHEICRYL
jgi:hypothetical protein